MFWTHHSEVTDRLGQIFQFLGPLDLLHLSRTSKCLRTFLLNRNKSLAFWKTAINNVGLPPCPDYISEPAYAHLAFVPLCHGCFTHCDSIQWELRLRCCPKCLLNLSVSIIALKHHLPGLTMPYRTKTHPSVPSPGVRLHRIGSYCHAPSTSQQYTSSEDGLEFYLADVFNNFICQHSSLCLEWQHKMLQSRADLHRGIFDERRNECISSSHWLGCNTRELLDHLDNGPSSKFGRLPQVKKLEPLTPGEWTEIRPQLVDYLRQHKAKRIEKLRPGTFRSRFWLLSTALYLDKERSNGTPLKVRPRGIDICLFPAVQKVIERVKFEFTMNTLAPMLPKLIRKWTTNTVKEVKRLAREQLGLSSEVDPSRHISVVFQCNTCRTMLRFDEALSHSHLYESTLGYPNRSSRTQKNCDEAPEVLLSSYEKLARAHYKCLPWNCSVLRVDTTSFHRINTLITMLGYDPATVTYDDPRLSDVAVTCDGCHRSRRTVMDIRAAVRFFPLEFHFLS
ncbi:hypothetical protein BU15DRAFT_48806 [Melanogaster broomeanus]|nr:hypothetical protein BU15DRAFT_48806 [Melanogaster broomeanus]